MCQSAALRDVAMSTFSIMKEQTERLMAESRRSIETINKDLKEVTAEYDELRSVQVIVLMGVERGRVADSLINSRHGRTTKGL